MLHQAFLVGAIYELDRYGQITRRLFEDLEQAARDLPVSDRLVDRADQKCLVQHRGEQRIVI